jgi:hypothetical protein
MQAAIMATMYLRGLNAVYVVCGGKPGRVGKEVCIALVLMKIF